MYAVIYKTEGILKHEKFETEDQAQEFVRELAIEGITEAIVRVVQE